MPTIDCPYCQKDAEIDDGLKCSHCSRSVTGEVAAKDYVEDVLGISHYATVKDGGDWPISHCGECGTEALVDFGPQDDPSGGLAALCFQCGNELHHNPYGVPGGATHCLKCGELFDSEDGITVCPDCFAIAVSKD